MDLKTVDVLALQTKHMQQDEAVRGYSAALTPQVRKLAGEIGLASIYARIDQLPEAVLDILAWQFNVLWYDISETIEAKRQAIKQSIDIHRIKGTPAAIERVIEIYFGDGQVEEWFQYGGTPGHFRITTTNPSATSEKAILLQTAIKAVKRYTSVLDSVTIDTSYDNRLYVGFAVQTVSEITVRQVM
jgi:phage tail P2-like protein